MPGRAPAPPGPVLAQDPDPNVVLVDNDNLNPNHMYVNHNLNFPQNGNAAHFNHNNILNGLTFSSQNVRSLNISTKNEITAQKILAICNLQSDFIFLSDIRLNSNKQISALHDVEKKFFLKGYTLVHNSHNSLRGVGILISKKILDKNFAITNTVTSNCGNFLGIEIDLNGSKLLLCSIYGPNRDADLQFFEILKTKLRQFSCPFIIGGDWNATFDNAEIGINLDTVNMLNIPSTHRTNKILEICDEFNLVEPFRKKNPTKREYTFIPSGILSNNRSRIDFFLISNALYSNEINVIIPHSLTSTLFDHKPVTLLLKRKTLARSGIIKDTLLNDVDLDSHVKSAVFECYLQHYQARENEPNLQPEINRHLLMIGRISSLLNEIKLVELNMAVNGFTELQDLTVSGKRAEINLIFEDLPDLPYFEQLPNMVSHDTFFLTLVNCIKNNVLSHQATVFKRRSEQKNILKNAISELKENFNANTADILRIERNLSDIIEGELRDELLHYKKFELLNAERITPHFMNLVKSSNKAGSLDEIKRDDGTDFRDGSEQKEFIQGYYKGIYKQEDNLAKNADLNSIKNFLGPIQHHPVVMNSKLSDEERDELESEITVDELTKSINNANCASAPGADGISNRFIKQYWSFFKNPLLKLCNFCYEKNELPMSFRTANIKLIPKKGDLSKIKNWRPISLLNCFYKIISRTITARLRKYMDKMTPICQKGYSGSRYCQEVLITVIEGIEKCNFSKRRACVISLDIKKAFDSLSHSFLKGVYEFFNMGPRLIKWITLLSTKRLACIILGSGKLTDIFRLERGNAQGDTISPFLFNLGYQILLFKLELSFQIAGTLTEEAERALNGVTAASGRAAWVSSDPKVSAMADDCTLLVSLTVENLQNIITCLNNFEGISGLGCNLEKTALMPVGNLDPLPQNIMDLGLTIVSEIFLLGAKIKNSGLCFEENGELILAKVKKQANFWRRFNLSLPGRINVSKSFLYSQINYLGCFMPISQQKCKEISSEIEKFVRGNLKIGTQKIYEKVENGGIGLFKLGDFLASQCCAWFKRASNLDEFWKLELYCGSFKNIFNVRKENFCSKKNPILRYLVENFEKFLFRFTTINENFRKSWIFENPCLTLDPNSTAYVKRNFFTQEQLTGNLSDIYDLKIMDILGRDDTIKSKEIFEQGTNLRLSVGKYNTLCRLVRNALVKYKKIDKNEKGSDSVKDFCARIRKGSKKFRKIISGKTPLSISTNMHRYAELLDQVINLENSTRLNLQWNVSYLPNSVRTFVFKLHNNLLGTNARVAHFVRNHSRECTFCTLVRSPEENPETITHLFFECPSIEGTISNFYKWWLDDESYNLIRSDYFLGFNYDCAHKNIVMDLTNTLVKQYIWDCKLRFQIPDIDGIKIHVKTAYKFAHLMSAKVRSFTTKSQLFDRNNEIRF